MKKQLLSVASAAVICSGSLVAQTTAAPKYKAEFYGFVRVESFYDTHKGLNAANELFMIVPTAAVYDANHKDINETGSYNLGSMATRFGVKVAGPEIFNAKTSANIEADFAGDVGLNTALLRIRQANVVFGWNHASLLVGQTWHPFWGGKNFPLVAGLNTGAPFQPFNRSPQVRLDYKTGKLTFTGALVSEFQYKSYGFAKIDSMVPAAMSYSAKTDDYSRNAAIPEMFAGLELNDNALTLGVGGSLKYIRPSLYTVGINPVGPDNQKYLSDALLRSLSAVGYLNYKKEMLFFQAKAVLGQNMTHLTMPGGYGVKSVDAATGAMEYTPYTTMTTYINAVYGKTYQVGIFAGSMKNMGTVDALYNFETNANKPSKVVTPGMLPNIASINRIAPHFAINIEKMRLVFEYERTTATYGAGTIDTADGLYSGGDKVVNNRAMVLMMYSF